MSDEAKSVNCITLRWSKVAAALGFPECHEAVLEDLCRRYREPWRHYHNLQHLEECFTHFDTLEPQLERPGEVELALWFHDAIHHPGRDDNEQCSAGFARRQLENLAVAAPVIERVGAMILATRGHRPSNDTGIDARAVLDADLAILSAGRARYEEYAAQVRKEYVTLSDADFRKGRCAVLRGFLAREWIYSTSHFRECREAQARRNIRKEMVLLKCE